MMNQAWKVALVGGLSCLCGINYSMYTIYDYSVLGINKGVLFTSLHIWGYILFIVGLLLLATLGARKHINVKMIDKQLEISAIIVFVLQLPIISLWFMALILQGIEAIIGIIVHIVLLSMSFYCFWSSHQQPKRQMISEPEQSDITH